MKYGELGLNQIEALVNKLGGLGVVRAILTGKGEVSDFVEELAFIKSLDKCLAIREMLRSWGKYGHDDGVSTFKIMVTHVYDQSVCIAEEAISRKCTMDERLKEIIIEKIEFSLREIVKFQTLDGDGFEHVRGHLEEIKNGLKSGVPIKVLKDACRLRSHLRGMEELNDMLLKPFDKANRHGALTCGRAVGRNN